VSAPLLEVSDLRKVFPRKAGIRAAGTADLVAVDDVSFTLPAGGCLAVVGESGSGKTTCARIIAGLESATDGTVTVDGEHWHTGRISRAERRRRARLAQMVFQDPYQSLDRRQTVAACLEESLRLHFTLSAARRQERIAQLLDLVGLTADHARALPRQLSGGQRQRVAIARALAPQPRLLILDEAVAALDVSIQAQILNLLLDTRAETGVALLFISHDLGVVRQIADEVLVMKDGRVVEYGPADAVFRAPGDPYTQRLLDSIPRPGWTPRSNRTAITAETGTRTGDGPGRD
jgi:oligopeptide transport system ATP-binding protein